MRKLPKNVASVRTTTTVETKGEEFVTENYVPVTL